MDVWYIQQNYRIKNNTLTIKLLKSFLNINVQAQESNASEYKERTKEVAHKVKHYGAFGEDYLGIIQLLSRYYLQDYLGIIQVLSTGLSRGLSRYYLGIIQVLSRDYLGIIYRIIQRIIQVLSTGLSRGLSRYYLQDIQSGAAIFVSCYNFIRKSYQKIFFCGKSCI